MEIVVVDSNLFVIVQPFYLFIFFYIQTKPRWSINQGSNCLQLILLMSMEAIRASGFLQKGHIFKVAFLFYGPTMLAAWYLLFDSLLGVFSLHT